MNANKIWKKIHWSQIETTVYKVEVCNPQKSMIDFGSVSHHVRLTHIVPKIRNKQSWEINKKNEF